MIHLMNCMCDIVPYVLITLSSPMERNHDKCYSTLVVPLLNITGGMETRIRLEQLESVTLKNP